MRTTILLFVSRKQYLEEVFEALEKLKCDIRETALLVIVNGEADLYIQTRNLVEMSKYSETLCIQEKPKTKLRTYDISGRRKRIAKLHNIAKEYINTEYVFGIEDDTIIPFYALEMIGQYYTDEVGVIEGVEMGRWGVPYIGAWIADNLEEPTELTSLPMSEGLIEVDACGFFCFLTRADFYKAHNFKPFDNNGLGPDTDFSLSLRKRGLKNYALFDVECVHKSENGDIKFGVTIPRQIKMYKKHNQWRQNIIS